MKKKLQDIHLSKLSHNIKDINRKHGVKLSYHQAWHEKKVAIKKLYNMRLVF